MEPTVQAVKKARAPRSSSSITKVRGLVAAEPMTIRMIKAALPELTPAQISMALVYLRKRNVLQRHAVTRTATFGRATVWAYTTTSSHAESCTGNAP